MEPCEGNLFSQSTNWLIVVVQSTVLLGIGQSGLGVARPVATVPEQEQDILFKKQIMGELPVQQILSRRNRA